MAIFRMLLPEVLFLSILVSCVYAGPVTPRRDVGPPIVDDKNYRLPQNIKPLHYDVELTTRLDPDFNFNGNVKINIQVLENNTKSITLHHRSLRPHEQSVKLLEVESQNDVKVSKITYDKVLEFYVIELETELKKDKKYDLSIAFEGDLDKNMDGFYRSSYKKGDKEE